MRISDWSSDVCLPIFAAIALLLLLGQIIYGAFTAGLGAGYAFASWPLMGDSLFPAGVPMLDPAWTNAIDNPVVVQFIHRWLAFVRSEEHTSELQSLMRISYAVFCLKKKILL